jgi:hypothetical protein
MRTERVLIVLGATLLVVSPALAVITWLPKQQESGASPEGPESIAVIIAGALVLVCFAAVSYLALEEWKEAKRRRAKTYEERRP